MDAIKMMPVRGKVVPATTKQLCQAGRQRKTGRVRRSRGALTVQKGDAADDEAASESHSLLLLMIVGKMLDLVR